MCFFFSFPMMIFRVPNDILVSDRVCSNKGWMTSCCTLLFQRSLKRSQSIIVSVRLSHKCGCRRLLLHSTQITNKSKWRYKTCGKSTTYVCATTCGGRQAAGPHQSKLFVYLPTYLPPRVQTYLNLKPYLPTYLPTYPSTHLQTY